MKLLSFIEFTHINENKLDKLPFEPKYASKAAVLASYINNQIEQLAKDLALERHLSDPKNYQTAEVQEVDRSRALKLVFHKNWRKRLVAGEGSSFIINARIKAKKKDDTVRKRNNKIALKLANDYDENNTQSDD